MAIPLGNTLFPDRDALKGAAMSSRTNKGPSRFGLGIGAIYLLIFCLCVVIAVVIGIGGLIESIIDLV